MWTGIREFGLGIGCSRWDESEALKACWGRVVFAIAHQSSLGNTRPGTLLEMGPICECVRRKYFATDGNYEYGQAKH